MDQMKNFPPMFTEIDEKKDKLSIESYGISITTLEEVFLRIGEDPEEKKEIQPKYTQEEFDALDEDSWVREDGACQRFCSHLGATILKRIRVIKRDLRAFIFELLLPLIVILLAMLFMRISFIEDFPSQTLNYQMYL